MNLINEGLKYEPRSVTVKLKMMNLNQRRTFMMPYKNLEDFYE